MTIAIVQNAALLLALAFLYDVVVLSRVSGGTARVRSAVVDAGTGLVLGMIGVAVMASRWEIQDGVILDTRSVVLALVGLFFGLVPVTIAVVITAAYRLWDGGAGATTGVAVIVASGAVGLAARRLTGPDLGRLRFRHLVVVGLVTHAVMLALFVIVPFEGSGDVVRDIAVPVFVIYTTAFVLLGILLLRRRRDVEVHQQLADSEARYRAVFDNDHMAVMVIDPVDGRILEVNQRAVDYYGWTREQLLSMSSSDLEVLPRDEVIAQIDDGIASGRSSFEFQHRLASGEVRDVEVIGGAVTIDGRMRVHVVINDITDRKRTERDLHAAQERLQQVQKMEAVGRLAGGIAHDFNNMLQVILGYTDVVLADTEPGSEIHEYLTEVRVAARRSADLTQQLLAFARRQPARPQRVDVAASVEASMRMLRRLVGEHVELSLRLDEDVWPTRIDPGQFSQVLTNLAINARDAVGAAGRVEIAARNVVIDAVDADDPPEARPGEFVEISITDDGEGIAPDVLGSIFEPFFTTRGAQGGTGLGLSIVYGIVSQHGGFIRVSSRPGAGAAFRVYLPQAGADVELAEWTDGDDATRDAVNAATVAVADDPRADDPRVEPEATRAGSSGATTVRPATVLVVEDEPGVLRLAERTLTQHGHVVIPAAGPDAALELADAHDGPIDVLLTDVVMPGLDVRELVRRIIERDPDLAVVYVSGYSDDVVTSRGVVDPTADLLPKPFTAGELVARVDRALGRSRASVSAPAATEGPDRSTRPDGR